MPTTARLEINRWKTALNGHVRARVKKAELGGDGQDTQFESAFSNLAHSYLREKAPSLQQYEVGFQLLERNQDGDRAVGILGFKVGSQWIYCPLFFLNGDIKGHELLYLKNEDQFVPLKENWVNSILNRKPNVLGKPIDRNLSRSGVSSPDLSGFSRPPIKMSSVKPELIPGVAAFAHFATTNPFKDEKYASIPTLASFLKKEGTAVVAKLVRDMKAFPKLAQAFVKVYGSFDMIREAIDANTKQAEAGVLKKWTMGEDPPKKAKAPTKANGGEGSYGHAALKSVDGYVRNGRSFSSDRYMKRAGVLDGAKVAEARPPQLDIYTMQTFEPTSDLSLQEREILLRDGLLVRDKRAEEETTKAYTVQTTMSLSNPDETGIYDLLVQPGSFERCLITLSPYSEDGRESFATVVRLGDVSDRRWLNIHPGHLWVKRPKPTPETDYRKYLESLPEATSLDVSESQPVILLGPKGQSTVPFKVEEDYGSNGNIKTYKVWFRSFASRGRPGNLPALTEPYRYSDSCSGLASGEELIVLTDREGGIFNSLGRTIYVPKGTKVLKLRNEQDGGNADGSSPPPLAPGTVLDLQRAIYEKTSSLKVAHLGSEVRINGGSPMTPLSGLIHLIRDHGLRKKAAEQLIHEAARTKVARCRVKYAYPYDLQNSGPAAPDFPDPMMGTDPMAPGAQSIYPSENEMPVDMGQPQMEPFDPMAPPDQQSIQMAMQAAQTGQKEVMDSSMMGSLLKQVRDDTMVSEHLPALRQAMDKLGRILFSFYWHGEQFQERYGKQDMPNLEDGLRNAFEDLGEIILELEKKTIRPYPDEDAGEDLQHAAA